MSLKIIQSVCISMNQIYNFLDCERDLEVTWCPPVYGMLCTL